MITIEERLKEFEDRKAAKKLALATPTKLEAGAPPEKSWRVLVIERMPVGSIQRAELEKEEKEYRARQAARAGAGATNVGKALDQHVHELASGVQQVVKESAHEVVKGLSLEPGH